MNKADPVTEWLLEGDASIRWQVLADLLDAPDEQIQAERRRVSQEGWGAELLASQTPDGLWDGGLYSPKWTSTTYTLLLLRDLGLLPRNTQALAGCGLVLEGGIYQDGGINFFGSLKHSETCVTGMVLSILSYFQFLDERLHVLSKHLLDQQLADGGWNCQSYKGHTHSSFNTTISVLEGLWHYQQVNNGLSGRIGEAMFRAVEFLLQHRLYRSHRTGEIASASFTRFSFPPRWHYDVLRGLDFFRAYNATRDERLSDAIKLLVSKRKPDGRWLLQNKHHGRVYFEMERVGEPSRWNTLRALRVMRWWNAESKAPPASVQVGAPNLGGEDQV